MDGWSWFISLSHWFPKGNEQYPETDKKGQSSEPIYIQKTESVYQFDDYVEPILWHILINQAIYEEKEYQVNPEYIQKMPINS